MTKEKKPVAKKKKPAHQVLISRIKKNYEMLNAMFKTIGQDPEAATPSITSGILDTTMIMDIQLVILREMIIPAKALPWVIRELKKMADQAKAEGREWQVAFFATIDELKNPV